MSGALVAGVTGLVLLFWALERVTLLGFHAVASGEIVKTPITTNLAMFSGLILINVAMFYALRHWSRHVRHYPQTRQLPVWFLFAVTVVSGAALVTGLATHSSFVQSHDVIPMDINPGFIAYQVFMGAMVLIPMVLLGVRWAPGYRPYAPGEGARG
jgi:hypothetical protein